ncbi:MAG: polysaccharide pyruvyl transferase family protein [Bryobacteraceae bacterium]
MALPVHKVSDGNRVHESQHCDVDEEAAGVEQAGARSGCKVLLDHAGGRYASGPQDSDSARVRSHRGPEAFSSTSRLDGGFVNLLLRRLGAHGAVCLRLFFRPHREDSILVAPSITGSLGDEAMLQGGVNELKRRGARRIAILCYEPSDRWNVPDSAVLQVCIPGLRRGIGVAGCFRLCFLAARYRAIFFIAADCLDGAYGVQREIARLELAELASLCALKVFISGFSFNRHPEKVLAGRISALPEGIHFRARDPLSLSRFQSETAKPAALTADIAFLIARARSPSGEACESGRWIAVQQKRGRLVVGLNLNQLFLRFVDDGESLIAELTIRLLQREAGLAIILVPHDRRGKVPDKMLHGRLLAALPEELRERVLAAPCPTTAGDAKWLAAHLDFLVSQRMHLAIAALGCGVPVMCYEYQDKAEGMLTHFGFGHSVIRSHELCDIERLADRILVAVREGPLRKRDIHAALPRVLELARHNFV